VRRRRSATGTCGCLVGLCVALLVTRAQAEAQTPEFDGPFTQPAGKVPVSIGVGDFNADDDPDLALGSYAGSTLKVMVGASGGRFRAPVGLAGLDNAYHRLVVADFNADSDPDIAVTEIDKITIVLGGPGASFEPPSAVTVPDGTFGLATDDFNQDGDPDLVVAGLSDSVSILLGRPGASFDPAASAFTGNFSAGVATGDFNADGDPDLAVTGGSSNSDLAVVLGAAGGTFGPPTFYPDGDGQIALGDVNADSDPDLLMTHDPGDGVSIRLGLAPGAGFGPPQTFPAGGDGSASLALDDLDGDTDLDVAVANRQSIPTIGILLGDGAGSFATALSVPTGETAAESLAAADFNGDSDPDLVYGQPKRIGILLNALHRPPPPVFTGTDPASPANQNLPRVQGAAEPGSTVHVYRGPDCSGPQAAVGSAQAFGSTGLTVRVHDDSVSTFSARLVSSRDLESPCSVGPIEFVEVSSAPEARIALAPERALTGDAVSFSAAASRGKAITRYEWDLDGNGSFETDTGDSPLVSTTYGAPSVIEPGVRVTNAIGLVGEARTELTVRLRPPAGRLGVSINDGAQFTNDPQVTVSAVWPPFSESIVLSNDGGFADPGVFPVAEDTPWVLDSSGSERLPRTIYARFGDAPLDPYRETYQDDIILDQTDPAITSAKAKLKRDGRHAASKQRTYRVRIKAKDKTSGVARMQVTEKKRKPGQLRAFRAKSKFTTGAKRFYVRVQDRAENFSRWKRVRPRAGR
jgi:hypothetical protein